MDLPRGYSLIKGDGSDANTFTYSSNSQTLLPRVDTASHCTGEKCDLIFKAQEQTTEKQL